METCILSQCLEGFLEEFVLSVGSFCWHYLSLSSTIALCSATTSSSLDRLDIVGASRLSSWINGLQISPCAHFLFMCFSLGERYMALSSCWKGDIILPSWRDRAVYLRSSQDWDSTHRTVTRDWTLGPGFIRSRVPPPRLTQLQCCRLFLSTVFEHSKAERHCFPSAFPS